MAIAPKPKTVEQEVAPRAPRNKSNKDFFIKIAGGVLALLIAGGGAYYYFVIRASAAPEAPPIVQIFVPLEVFTVNLKPESGDTQQYLQAMITLQVPSEKDAQALKDRMPEVRNRILFILSAKTSSEISTVDGKTTLINEILEAIKKPFAGSESEQSLTGGYFTSFIIQ